MDIILDKPVLVAGGSGFVGSHIVRLLTKRGRKVRVLLRTTSDREALKDLPVGIVHGDVLDPSSIRAAMEVSARDFYALAVAGRGQVMPRLTAYHTAYAIASVVELAMRLMKRSDNIVNGDAVYLSRVFREMDNGKARRELNRTPRPLSETVRDAVDWFSARETGSD